MLYVIAQLQLHSGRRHEFLAEFARVVPLVRAEEGCMMYLPTIDAITGMQSQSRTGDDSVTVVEQWASAAALEAHDRAEHMRTFRERVKGMVAQREIRVLEPA